MQAFISRLYGMWTPDWIVSLSLLLLSVACALALQQLITVILRRVVSPKHIFARSLLARTAAPTRLAFLIFGISAVLPTLDLTERGYGLLQQCLLVAFIVLIGWVAITSARIGSDIYLRRFRIDVEDNLLARKHVTQIGILRRAVNLLIMMVTVSAALMTFESVRQYGVSLFASAGAAGLIVGFAAKPLLTSLIAGIQIAMTQPIRVEDAVVVEGEWGWIEEINATYVVIRLWDWRRMIVPLSYFIEQPFQNWTRESASIIGTVFIYADYSVPVAKVRTRLEEIARESPLWDGKVVNLQVSDATERTIQIRALVSARNSPQAWDLRCEVREKLVAWLNETFPNSLPRLRAEAGSSGPLREPVQN